MSDKYVDITGAVRDADGQPVFECIVTAFEEPETMPFDDGPVVVNNPRPIVSDLTDETGAFGFRLPLGPCRLHASAPRDCDFPGSDSLLDAVAMHVSEDSSRRPLRLDVEYAVESRGSIEGIVRRKDGTAWRGATVEVDGRSMAPNSRTILQTDEGGRFRADGLLCGERTVQVMAARGYATLIETVHLKPRGLVELDLSPPGSDEPASQAVDVTCVDQEGVPLSGIPVRLKCLEDFDEVVHTGPDGTVRVEGLPDRFLHWAWILATTPGSRIAAASFDEDDPMPPSVRLVIEPLALEERTIQWPRYFPPHDGGDLRDHEEHAP